MPVDYSRFDRIVDSDDDEAPLDVNAPLDVFRPMDIPPPRPPPRETPPDVMDDLNDYFSRLEMRRRESTEASSTSAPPTVDRFSEAEVATQFEQVTFSAETCSYTECSVCLNDFTAGEVLLQLPCAAKHVLHAACAKNCLTRSALCPLCRVDLRPIVPTSVPPQEQQQQQAEEEEEYARPVTPRQLGYTRDGGVILRYEPNPSHELPRPAYIPAELHDQASYVEISYPDQGVARVWRVPRELLDARRMQPPHPA